MVVAVVAVDCLWCNCHPRKQTSGHRPGKVVQEMAYVVVNLGKRHGDIVSGQHAAAVALVGALLTLNLLPVAVPAGGTPTTSGVLRQDETWSSHVQLTGDVVVPTGITLTIAAGTTVAMTPQQSDHDVSVQRMVRGRKRELSHPGLIDLIVEGRLHAKGGWWWRGIRLGSAGEDVVGWGGLLFLGDNKASRLRYMTIHHAHTAVRFLDHTAPELSHSVLKLNVNGLEVYQEAAPLVVSNSIRANFRGMGIFDQATPQLLRNIVRLNNQGLFVSGSAKPTVMYSILSKNTTGVLIKGQAAPLLQHSRIGKRWPGLLFRGNRRGVVIAGRAAPTLRNNVIRGNKTGIIMKGQSTPTLDANTVTGNETDVVDKRKDTS